MPGRKRVRQNERLVLARGRRKDRQGRAFGRRGPRRCVTEPARARVRPSQPERLCEQARWRRRLAELAGTARTTASGHRPVPERSSWHAAQQLSVAAMTISRLPLGYCSNVHPGRCLDEVLEGLRRYAGPVGRNLGRPTSVGLWLAAPVVHELLSDRRKLERLRAALSDERLCCYSLNAFPFGDFHKRRVKREVYRPDWADEQRLQYTLSCAQVLGELLPEDVDGSVSTLPLGFASDVDEVRLLCSLDRLVDCADQLAQLADRTGRVVRLALEPEPFCWLERTERVVTFFQKALWPHADRRGRLDAVRRHIGVCLDVCHQAVLFEDVGQSVRRLAEADVRVNKVHVTCALKG